MKDEGKPAPTQYAAIVWRPRLDPTQSLIKVTFGWGLKFGEKREETWSNAWSFETEFDFSQPVSERIFGSVEDPLGVFHARNSPKSDDWNAHCERLVADHLLFFVHRALFGQCRGVQMNMPGENDGAKSLPVVDQVLVYGPTLPKFVGRICYSHFHRSKTVAVIAPDVITGQAPSQTNGSWSPEPTPSFAHDFAKRRWTSVDDKESGERKVHLASFDLIIPTGDGMSGRLIDGAARGETKWRRKAQDIQELLDRDATLHRIESAENSEAMLPSVMIAAFQSLQRHDCLAERIKAGFDHFRTLKSNLRGQEAKHFNEIVDAVDNSGIVIAQNPQARFIRGFVVSSAWQASEDKFDAGSSAKAARRVDAKRIVADTQKRIQLEFGAGVFSLV